MKSFGKKCIELRKKDMSIGEIVKITGHGKSSVYPYIKDIPLSKKRQKRVRQMHTERIINFNKKRRGVSARKFKKFKKWNRGKVFLVSHLLFDGQIIHAGCIYHNRSTALTRRVQNYMQEIYSHNPIIKTNKKTGVTRVSYYNVALGKYLKQKSTELLRDIATFPLEHKRAFLSAFFDDEGCVDFKNNRRRVRGYQNNKKLLKLVQKLLLDFDIESSIGKSYVHEIVISRKENLIKFRDEINFSPGVRINGKRKNSVWKKDLEKRKILDMALESYQN